MASARPDSDTGIFWCARQGQEPMLPTVQVVAGPDVLGSVAIYPGERVVLGRSPDCDLVLTEPSVSRQHLAVTDRDGELWIEDLGSTNGTAIGPDLVEEPARIDPGTMFYAGNVALRIDRMSLRHIQHLERVARRIRRDPLTGVLARGWLDDELPALAACYRGQGWALSALFVDVDRFKRINDTHGHAAGDDVLRVVARLLEGGMRDLDRVVRYGGEEFVAVVGSRAEDAPVAIAERLRRDIERHDWSRYRPELAVTVSVGVATLTAGEALSAWLERADRAMYEAKTSGRNRVVAAPSRHGLTVSHSSC